MASTPVRVLLVDDHPVMRDGLQQLLERTGEFEVVGHAGDGEEAERVAKEVVPDLVIMDVLMPGRDGIDACREIIDALEDVRVLMLTASTEKDAVIEAVAAGADGYLQKFTGTEQLLAMVRDVAGGEYRMPRDVMRRVFRRLRHLPEEIDSPRRKALTDRGRRRYSPSLRRGCRTPPLPSPGATALRQSATPSTAYRTSWDSTASRRSSSGPCETDWWIELRVSPHLGFGPGPSRVRRLCSRTTLSRLG